MLHRGEALLEAGEQSGVEAALEGLGDERAAGRQILKRKIRCRIRERSGADLVRACVASCVGGHIRKHQIRRAAKRIHQNTGCVIIQQIEFEERRAWKRLYRQEINADNRARAALHRDRAEKVPGIPPARARGDAGSDG